MQLAKTELLILDDWGMASVDGMGLHDLLEIVDDRIYNGSLIITSQLPVSSWHDYIGEPTIADAILDRILHNAHKITLQGGAMENEEINSGCTKHLKTDQAASVLVRLGT